MPCSTAKLRCRASRLEGKHSRTTTAAEVSAIEAYLDPRVHYPARQGLFKLRHCDRRILMAALLLTSKWRIIKLGRVQLAREQEQDTRSPSGRGSEWSQSYGAPPRTPSIPAKLKELLQPQQLEAGSCAGDCRGSASDQAQLWRRSPDSLPCLWSRLPSAASPLSSATVVRFVSELPGLATTLEVTLSWD